MCVKSPEPSRVNRLNKHHLMIRIGRTNDPNHGASRSRLNPAGLHASPGPIQQDEMINSFIIQNHKPEQNHPEAAEKALTGEIPPEEVIISAALLKYVVFSHDLSAPVSHYIQLFLFPQTRRGRRENTTWIPTSRDSGGKPILVLLGRRVYVSSKTKISLMTLFLNIYIGV